MTCKLNGIKAPATLGLEVMAKKWLMQNLPLYHKLRIKLFAASTTKNDEFLVEIFLTSEATSLNQLAVKENVLLTYSA